jgi:hypothetical protein
VSGRRPPLTFFLGEGGEGRGDLCKVLEMGVEEITQSKKISDFINVCGWWSISNVIDFRWPPG